MVHDTYSLLKESTLIKTNYDIGRLTRLELSDIPWRKDTDKCFCISSIPLSILFYSVLSCILFFINNLSLPIRRSTPQGDCPAGITFVDVRILWILEKHYISWKVEVSIARHPLSPEWVFTTKRLLRPLRISSPRIPFFPRYSVSGVILTEPTSLRSGGFVK